MLASASSMPSLSTAIVGPSPADPTIALRTTSGSLRAIRSRTPSSPARTVPRQPESRAAAAASASARATVATPAASACTSRRSQLESAESPAIRISADRPATSIACSPIEPVEPRMSTSFTGASVGTSADRLVITPLSGARPPGRGSRRRDRAWNRAGAAPRRRWRRSSPRCPTTRSRSCCRRRR